VRPFNQQGSASVELIALLPYLLLAALFAWQLLVAAFTAVNAENAARNGSRVEGRGGDGIAAAIDTLQPALRDAADATVSGGRATVTVRIPILVPGLTHEGFSVTQTAELPSTD
jgi:hypothetical protein